MVSGISVATCVLVLAVFLPFAAKAQRDLAAGKRAPRDRFQFEATFHVADTLASAREYEKVPGFEDKKRRLRNFIDEQARLTRIEAP
jgi:NifB/MoaA-like Fe-S oxidoreductase